MMDYEQKLLDFTIEIVEEKRSSYIGVMSPEQLHLLKCAIEMAKGLRVFSWCEPRVVMTNLLGILSDMEKEMDSGKKDE